MLSLTTLVNVILDFNAVPLALASPPTDLTAWHPGVKTIRRRNWGSFLTLSSANRYLFRGSIAALPGRVIAVSNLQR